MNRTQITAAIVGLVAAIATLFASAPAQADCLLPGVSVGCTAPSSDDQTLSPDPGGTESPDQPVPYPGKVWGFNLGYPASGSATTALQALVATGATVLRDEINWSAFSRETSPSQPVPAEMQAPVGSAPSGSALAHYDQEYLDLISAGITPDFIVAQAPLWASTLHSCAAAVYFALNNGRCGNSMDPPQPLYPDAEYYPQWRSFVTAVARRYPKALIEGPNEPDQAYAQLQAGRGDPGAVNSSTAAAIQCQLFDAVRSVDNRTVLSSGLSIASYYSAFIDQAKSCYDVFSFHAYPYATNAGDETYFGAGSGLAQLFGDLRAARTSAGDTTPIWVTETGFDSSDSTHGDVIDEQQFANASERLYNRLVTMSDVQGVLFHTLRDVDDHYGFFYNDWTPKARACYFVRAHGSN